MEVQKSKPWYHECIDKCKRCKRKGILCKTIDDAFFVKCRKCNDSSNSHENVYKSLINWNIKQRK